MQITFVVSGSAFAARASRRRQALLTHQLADWMHHVAEEDCEAGPLKSGIPTCSHTFELTSHCIVLFLTLLLLVLSE